MARANIAVPYGKSGGRLTCFIYNHPVWLAAILGVICATGMMLGATSLIANSEEVRWAGLTMGLVMGAAFALVLFLPARDQLNAFRSKKAMLVPTFIYRTWKKMLGEAGITPTRTTNYNVLSFESNWYDYKNSTDETAVRRALTHALEWTRSN